MLVSKQAKHAHAYAYATIKYKLLKNENKPVIFTFGERQDFFKMYQNKLATLYYSLQ